MRYRRIAGQFLKHLESLCVRRLRDLGMMRLVSEGMFHVTLQPGQKIPLCQ